MKPGGWQGGTGGGGRGVHGHLYFKTKSDRSVGGLGTPFASVKGSKGSLLGASAL